jgi:NAD(P)-dependent dehydrogenase (short-subunit alcohol dehydrogenase family)
MVVGLSLPARTLPVCLGVRTNAKDSTKMPELKQKVAIITGGGQGIGKQIALAFAHAGAKLALAQRSSGPLEATCVEIKGLGGEAVGISANISAEADCTRLAQETVKKYGRIDILVNNAGLFGVTKATTDMSLAEWNEVVESNLTGTWLMTRAVLPVMVKQQSGNIINIGSTAGRRGYTLRAHYSAAKWAIIGLTQTWAVEWGKAGIRVNCVCPGAVQGERIERAIKARMETLGTTYERAKQGLTAGSPMGRMVSEEEVARAVLFVASDLSAGMTGQSINVDVGAVMN